MKFLGSRTFFRLVVVLLALQALWIALTARYPQAFDEQVHFGLIQLHAHTWLPFFTSQPAGADAYGAVVRDPSYLYHYLLSFPYRLLRLVTANEVAQVIVLRLLNIGMLCSALPIFRRVLRRLGLSAALTNIVLLLFVITPVVPLLAAQINYDNLVVPLAGLLVLACLRLQQVIRAGDTVTWKLILFIITLSALGSLVKYPFLPFAAVATIYTAWQLLRRRIKLAPLRLDWKMIVLSVLCLLSLGLFAERYAVNLVRYHTPTPECDQVISAQRCEAYSPWLRNKYFATQFKHPGPKQIADYPASWLDRMIEESLFAIGSGFNSGVDVTKNNFGTVDYWQARSLVVPRILAVAGLIAGTAAVIWQAKALWRRPAVRLSFSFVVVYLVILFLLNLSDYLHIGTITAVHGRYALPVLPIIVGIFALALKELLAKPQLATLVSPRRQVMIIAVLLVIFWAQGGGLVTYWVRSERRWFWPQIAPAQTANADIQKIVRPLVAGSHTY